MSTPFTNVFDMFLTLIDDYRLITLFQVSPENFTTYLTGWLIPSIDDFKSVCDQDLSYNLTTKYFTNTLTSENISVLTKIMKKYWMNRLVDDVSQIQAKIQTDFSTYSEAQNYKTKQDRYIEMKEEVSIILNQYSYDKDSTWDALMSIINGG